MKQTNNAIKFLLAQYRAIFKHAYLKGLVSAAVLTAGLSATANAANLEDLTNLGDTYTIVGNQATGDQLVNIKLDGKDYSNFTGQINVKGGATNGETHNLIKDTSIAGSGSLLVDTGAEVFVDGSSSSVDTGGLNILASGDNVAIDLSQIKIDSGTLNLSVANNKTSSIVADEIIIEGTPKGSTINEDSSKDLGRATVQLGNEDGNGSGEITLGDKDTVLTVTGEQARLVINGTDSGSTLAAGNVTIDSGAAIFAKVTNASGKASITSNKVTMNSGEFLVHKESSGNFSINLTATTDANGNKTAGIFDVKGGTVNVNSKLTLNHGVLNISDEASFVVAHDDTASGDIASVVIDAAQSDISNALKEENKAVLQLSNKKLAEFLDGGISGDFSDMSGAKTEVGAVVLTSGGSINFTDATDISSFKYASGPVQSGSGKIFVSGEGLITGQNLSISNKLTDSGDGLGSPVTLSGSNNLHIQAENLTLGGGKDFESAKTALGIASAEARNVVFNYDNATNVAFTLKDKLTLSSTRSITSGGKPVVVGEDGSIVGELNIGTSGELTVDGGIYNASDKITINGGTLTVQNSGDGTQADVSSLTVNNLVIDLSTAATIKVDGGLSAAYDSTTIGNDKLTKLDLSNGFTITGDNSKSGTFVITSGGVAVVDAYSVQKVIDTVEASGKNSGSILFTMSSGGLLSIDGGLSLDFTDSNATALNNILNIQQDGIFEADSLDVTAKFASNGDSTQNGLGFDQGTIRVDNLSLNNLSDISGKEAEVAYLTGGNFIIGSKLSSKDTITLANDGRVGGGNAAINLVFKTAEVNGSGTIEAKGIKIESASGTVSLAQGNWSAGTTNFEIANGTMNVGSLAANGEVNGTASLTAGGLTATAGALNVYKGSTATFDTLTQAGTAITVNGKLTINGKESGEDTSKSWGANTTGGTIKVAGNDAVLTFGSTALGGISLDGDTIKYANGDTFTNNITLESFATLELDFANTDGSMHFTEEGLKNLRKEFISDNNGEVLQAGYIDIGAATIDGVTVNSDGTISWNNLEKISDIIADIKQDDLSSATLVDVDGSDVVNANVGNIKADGSTQSVTVGQTTLNKANDNGYFITNENGDLVSASVTTDGTLGLYNGGQIKDVTLDAGATDTTTLNVVSSGEAVTTINSIKGGANTLVNIDGATVVNNSVDVENLNVNQNLTVTKDVTLAGDLTSSENVTTGKISARELTVKGDTAYSGDLELAGNATFTGYAYLGGNNTFNGNTVSFKSGANLDHGTTTAKTIFVGDGSAAGNLEITGNAQVTADVIESTSGKGVVLSVGEEAGSEGDESWDSSAGFLTVGRLDLDGGKLITDPEYGKSATIVAVDSFGDSGDYTEVKGNEAGNLNGQIIALRNSIVGIGVANNDDAKAIAQLQDTFSRYLDANGSLNGDKVGSIVYVAKALDIDNANSKIIVDSSKSFSDYESAINAAGTYATNINDNNIYLGSNSVLAVSDYAALDSKAGADKRPAIDFTYTTTGDGEASLYAEKDAKIVLVGDGFSSRDTVYLFDDSNNDGILINGNNVTVETINGLLSFTLTAGTETTGGDLTLNRDAVASAFSMASAPVKYSLISYAANDNNWEDTSVDHNVEELHGDAASGISTDNCETFYKTGDANKTPVEGDYVAIDSTDANGNTTYNVYHDAYNYFLDDVVRNSTTGLAAEQAARLAVYGGAAQAALTAGATTYDAISGRLGVGAQTGSITFADNGQGAGLWVSPVYKNHDSDGFGSQGASYGVDMDLYGVALGGDYTLSNGLRFGAAFNVGSGDADGQGTGNGVSNDFDYYGFAVYGGFSYDKLSIVGDISYTVVDNDVEANTEVEKITASMDSTNLSVGVTGQYTFNYAGMNIVPHAGLRYTNIDLDDYNVKGSGDIAHFNADSFNVFSIPVGVTISKEIIAGEWTILPAFDVTLTANMGDDSVEGSVAWAGINNMTTKIESEVIDSFTYGATLGVSAKTGNLSLGFGVNYTGASSADEYGVGANARFVF